MVIKGVYIEEKCFNYNFCFSKWVCFGVFKYKFRSGTNSFCQFSRGRRRKSYYNRGYPFTANHTRKVCQQGFG